MNDDTPDTIEYEIRFTGGAKKRVTIPASWRVTYGPLTPGVKGGAYGDGEGAVLRMYENKDKQRAMFRKVVEFFDTSLPTLVEVVSTVETGERRADPDGYQEIEEAQVRYAPGRWRCRTMNQYLILTADNVGIGIDIMHGDTPQEALDLFMADTDHDDEDGETGTVPLGWTPYKPWIDDTGNPALGNLFIAIRPTPKYQASRFIGLGTDYLKAVDV